MLLEPLPSGDPRWIDCTNARGDTDVEGLLAQRIEGASRSTIQLISGHRGCGKSTELLRLAERLERTLSSKGIAIDERLSRGIIMWFAEVINGWNAIDYYKQSLAIDHEI